MYTTSTYQLPAAPAPRPRLRLFWILGLALLSTSLASVGFVFHSQASNAAAEAPPAAAKGGPVVVCLGHVDVDNGIIALFPSQPYRVTEVLVHENEPVKAGAALLRLDDRLARLRRQEAEEDVKAAEAQVSQARKQYQFKTAQQESAIKIAQYNLEAARQVRDRKQQLLQIKQLSIEEASAAEAQVKALETAEKAERERLRELDLLDPAKGETFIRAEADVNAKRSRLQQAEYALEECELKAPVEGTALRVLANVGDQFGPQARQAAILICPSGQRIIRAEVEQEFAGRVAQAIGQTAIIEDDTRVSGVWHGKVTRVSDWFTHRRSILQEPLQFNDVRTVECIIKLDEEPKQNQGQSRLRIGQRVRVTLGR